MAKKITLGKRPTSFKRVISFPMPGEEAGSVEVHFKYRTRTEYAAFMDGLQAEIQAAADGDVKRVRAAIADGENVANPTQADITARQNEFNVRYLLDALEGWNLDVPFDEEAVTQLVDELPAAVNAIVNDYRAALTEGRLGN
jgi:hypothetical protein